MSSIKYTAELDSKKLDDAIKQSNKTIKDWSKDVEKSSGQIDKAFDKTAKNFKENIREQKQLIKDIEGDIKRLQKAYDNTAGGRQKTIAGTELNAAKRALAEEQARLNQLQQEQIKAEIAEEGSIGNLTKGIGKWALGLVSVGAALKIAKSIIDSTEESAKKFEIVISQAKSAVGYFFKTIATGDWSNFGDNLDKAIKGAAEFVEQMDRLTNRQNEQKIKSAGLDKEIAELRDATYDKDEANNEARKTALEGILVLQEQKYTQEAALAKEVYETNLKKAATDSGLAKQQIENFIAEYSSLEKLIEIGEEYNDLTSLIRKPGMNAEYVNGLLEERDALGANAEAAGKYVTQISKVTPEVRKQLSDFKASEIEAEAAFDSKNRRDKMQLAQVTNAIKDEEEARKKKAIEDAKIENQIIAQKKQLDKAIEEGNKVEIDAISARIVKLEEELYIRQKIAETAIGAAITRETPLDKIGLKIPSFNPKGLKVPTKLAGKPIAEPGKYIPGTVMLSEYGKDQQKKKSAEEDKESEDSLKRQLDLRNQIVNAAANLVYQIGQSVGLSQEEMQLLGGSLDAFTKLASGDLPGAAISMISGLLAMIPNEAEKFALQTEHLNNLIAEQQRLIELSERKGGKDTTIKDQMKLLQEQKEINEKQIRVAEIALKDKKGFMFGLGIGVNSAKKKLEEAKQAAIDTQNAIEDLQQELDDFITGDITENTIADVIAQGFQEGKTSVDDFADYMNQVLIDAVMSVFTDSLLSSPKMKDYMEWLKGAMTGGITDAEKEENARRIAEIAAENKAAYEAMTSGLSIGGSLNAGLTGQIQRAITEETGSELAGLFRRFADDERAVKDYTLAGLNNLTKIEANTFQTVVQLQLAVTELQGINKNTKQVPAGAL